MEDKNYWKNRPLNDERRDWRIEGSRSWIEEYKKSENHPHRELIIKELKRIGFDKMESLIEIGSNCGPNISLIEKHFPKQSLTGIDPNRQAVNKGNKNHVNALFYAKDTSELSFFQNKEFDILLCDAVLMYLGPDEIFQAMKEFKRITSKYMIFVEWESKNTADVLGSVQFHHWTRDYKALFEMYGLKLDNKIKIGNLWPTQSWSQIGFLYTAQVQ